MKLSRLLPLIALLGLGCKSDAPADTSVDSPPTGGRPAITADRQTEVNEALAGQKIGRLLDGKISWLKDGKYQKGELDRAPDLYLFYFTASW